METWTYRDHITLTEGLDLAGYDVEASDGRIGTVDAADNTIGSSYLVVDTGWWIFGTKRLIPAATVQQVDVDRRIVHLGITKEGVKHAPDFDDAVAPDHEYRQQIGTYYHPFL